MGGQEAPGLHEEALRRGELLLQQLARMQLAQQGMCWVQILTPTSSFKCGTSMVSLASEYHLRGLLSTGVQ